MLDTSTGPTRLLHDGCTHRPYMRLKFENQVSIGGQQLSSGAFANAVECWMDALTQIWNNRWIHPLPHPRYRCLDVEFVFDYNIGTYDEQADTSWHHVTVVGNAAGAHAHPPTNIRGRGSIEIDIDDDPEVFAHEVGHLFRLDDEYGSNPVPSTPHHVANATPVCLMLSTAVREIVVPPDHMRTILHALGATWHWSCCIWPHPFAFLWEWLGHLLHPPQELHAAPPLPDVGSMDDQALFDMIDTASPNVMALIGNEVALRRNVSLSILLDERRSSSEKRRWLAAVGLGHVASGDRTKAIAALTATLQDTSLSVRLEAAHSLYRNGSPAGGQEALTALTSEAVLIRHPPILARAFADRILRKISGTSVGFDPHAPEFSRNEARIRWKDWWLSLPSTDDD